MVRFLSAAVLLGAFAFPAGAAQVTEQSLAASTIVVYNKAVAESAALAKFYAQARRIPADHVIALTCSEEEEISRDDYDTTIAQPLREMFKARKWWTIRESSDGKQNVMGSTIHYVALIRGMPMKIKATTQPYPGDEPGAGPINDHNEASVDSELAALAFVYRHISGAAPNPYFQAFRGIADFDNATLLLVCRLDAPSAAMVRRMITDAIATEKTGLWGRAFLDGSDNAAPGFALGDQWIKNISTQLRGAGVPVVYENTNAVYPDGYPVTDCSLYYGWYAGDVFGPFARPDFKFVPGAVAVHIHSFSAKTLRDPNSGWVAPLISHGAAASMGNVYEPYLQLTSYLDIFNDRLIHGFTFAESAYMSMHGVSWMGVMVGDPLYRPFLGWAQIEGAQNPGKGANEWKAYHDLSVQSASKPAADVRKTARQLAARAKSGMILEDLGGQEYRDGNFAAASSYFTAARASYTKRDDILRVVIQEVQALIPQKKQNRALDLVRSVLRIISPETPTAQLLRKIENDLLAAGAVPKR